MDIRSIFPTPIAIIPNCITSEERLQLIEVINNITHNPHGAISGDGLSTHKQAPNLLDISIKKRIQTALDEYNTGCGYKLSKLGNIWSNIQNSGSKLLEHVHPPSLVSGALYINVGEECKLYFHNPNPYVYYTVCSDNTPYTFQYNWIPVHNCELILFPSWLKHGKNDYINKMDGRMVVSFNSYTKHTFADI